MPFNNSKVLSTILGVTLLLWCVGCGSSSSLTGAKKDWSAEIGYERLETSHIEPDRESVLLGEGKKFVILDGRQGTTLRREPESQGIGGMFKSMIKESVSVNVQGIEVTNLFSEADRFSFAFLDFADAMIILDYTSDSDIIRMIDMTTGEELWKSEDYQWSIARYQNMAGEVSKAMLQNIGLGAGAAAGITGAELTRERYAQNLVRAIPEQDALLFRTTDGLLMLDARTAEVKWQIDDFSATGIQFARYMDDSDELLLVTYVSHLFDALSESRRIMRIDANDGTVKWANRYQHGSQYLNGLEVVDNRILLHYVGSQAEVFDLASGEVVIRPQRGAAARIQRWVQSQADDSTVVQPPAKIIDNSLYTINTTNPGAFEHVRSMLAAYDLESGEEKWITEPLNNSLFISNLIPYGNNLIATPIDAEKPVVAVSQSDGSITWGIEDLGSAVHAHLYDNKLYLTDSDLLRTVDPQTGETLDEVSLKEKGLSGISDIDVYNGNIYLVGSKGVALYSANDLEEINVWLPKGQIEKSERTGDRLFVQTSPLFGFNTYLRAMDLNTGTQITELKIFPGLHSWFGNFRNGVFVTGDGSNVYIMDDENTLTKYTITPEIQADA